MALTGLLLFGFLVMHLAANLMLYVSPEKYNLYGHTLTKNPLIYVAEVGLVLLFLYHIVDAITLKLGELKSRPQENEVREALGKSTVYSRTMIWSGLAILVFVIIHVATFKFGRHIPVEVDGQTIRDLYALVKEKFANPWYSGFYVAMMILLGFHLAHALQSSLRTLGFAERRWLRAAKILSLLVALLFTVGFGSMPIYFYFTREM
jgi:succinate dehydrogenase / fumarate reductase cytochrome b subunit